MKRQPWLAAALLGILILAAFAPVRNLDFVDYDDGEYVYQNPSVTDGLSAKGTAWAFTSVEAYNWHPLTWLSLQLDSSLSWPSPRGFHLTNLILHLLASLFLFAALREMTGGLWRSFWIAALFAIHPLRVESVAWVAERKDVLSAFFWMAILYGYARYVKTASPRIYALLILLYGLGLMAKPTLVALPCALLLLDYWPLGRLRRSTLATRLIEKTPFFGLAAISCAVTLSVQHASGAVRSFDQIALGPRLANALVTYVAYLGQLIYPHSLAAFYPYPLGGVSTGKLAGAMFFLLVVSVTAWRRRARKPHWFTGWFWYLGTLVPMIGIVQVGWQSMADRYTYIPSVGIAIALVYEIAAWRAAGKGAARLTLFFGTAALGSLILVTRAQISHWRDAHALWAHALSIDPDNEVARANFCRLLVTEKKISEAIACYESAATIETRKPIPPRALQNIHQNLGFLMVSVGRWKDAEREVRAAITANPEEGANYDNLGTTLTLQGELEQGAVSFIEALRRGFLPRDDLYVKVADSLTQKGKVPLALDLLGRLAAEYANHRQYAAALETARNARDLARKLKPEQLPNFDEAVVRYEQLAVSRR